MKGKKKSSVTDKTAQWSNHSFTFKLEAPNLKHAIAPY